MDVNDARIQVRVGETVFHTTKATLIESRLFASLFTLPPPDDGEYFIDNDPELFKHVLRYLRTKLYPLFFDRETGHDKVMYSAMIHQAEFYQIESLSRWLRDRKWMLAVRKTTKHFSHAFNGKGQLDNMHTYWARDEELTITSALVCTKKKKKCPAGIWEHDGGPTGTCVREGCHSLKKPIEPVSMTVLEVEGYLTKVTVLQDLLRRGEVDSSEVVVAAMQNPPPYDPEDRETPLPTQPLPPSAERSSGSSRPAARGHGGWLAAAGGGAAAAAAGGGGGGC